MRFWFLCVLIAINANAEVVCKSALQKYFIKKVYEITLCKENGIEYDNIFQTSFSIQLEYKMSSSGNWIGKRAFQEISKQYALTPKEVQNYTKHFHNFFPNVQNGDKIKLEFSPKYGAKFYYNGNFFGDIKDIEFAIRTANIWLHPNSTFQDTRNFLFLK